MDQINSGILKTKQFPTTNYVQGTRFDPNAKREEPIFDALLVQKSKHGSSEEVVERPRKTETDREENATEGQVKQDRETTVVRKDEEETCDVAREVATSQIIWFGETNAAELKVPDRMEADVMLHQSQIVGTNDEPVKPKENLLLTRPEELPEELMKALRSNSLIYQNRQPSEGVRVDVPKWYTSKDKYDVKLMGSINGKPIGGEEAAAEASLFQGIEAAPIKVAEAPVKTEQNTPVEHQVTQKLSNLLANGETRVQIQLEPVELGKLTIELTRSADGSLSILLDAEKTQTRSLLEKSIGTLQDNLIERGQKVVQINVQHNEESQRQEQQQNNNNFADGRNGQHQQEQQRRDDRRGDADFMQQLRLELIPIEEDDDN